MAGALHDETMVIWDELTRWGYVVDRATQPLAVSQLEVNEFEDAPGGTLVRWILACDPLDGMTFLAGDRPMQEFLAEIFAGAMRGLEDYVARRQ